MAVIKHKFRLRDGTVKQSDDWYFRFTYKGKQHFGSTKTSNKTLAKRVEAKKYEEVVKREELGHNPSITIETAFDNYLSSVEQSGEIRNITRYMKKMLGSKKQLQDGVRQDTTIFGFDGTRPFDKLDVTDIQKLILARRKESNTDQTILHEICYLNQCITLNRKLGHPVPTIDFPELKKSNKLKPAKGRLRYLSKGEEDALLKQLHPDAVINGIARGAISEDDIKLARQDIYDMTVILLDTAARYSEIAKLEIASVNLTTKKIALYRPKVKNESTLPMTPRVFEILERRIKSSKEGQKYVFENKAGDARNYAPGAFKSACKRAGITGITLHSLRHTTASRLVQKGASLYEVQKMLGHASSTTTQRYAHLVPEQAFDKMARILTEIQE